MALKDPFGASIPQVPLGAILNHECVFAELGEEEDVRRYQADQEWRLALNRAYNDKAERIVLEFLRDFDMARERRGLVFATAGSINNGTRLSSMRLVMAAIQRYGRYGG